MFLKIDSPTDRAGNGPWTTTVYDGQEFRWRREVVSIDSKDDAEYDGIEFLCLEWSPNFRQEEVCRGEQIETGRVEKDGKMTRVDRAVSCVYLMNDGGQTIERIQ